MARLISAGVAVVFLGAAVGFRWWLEWPLTGAACLVAVWFFGAAAIGAPCHDGDDSEPFWSH